MSSKPVVTGGALWNNSFKKTSYEPPLDPNNCGDWVMVSDNESFRCYELHLGEGDIVRKTEAKGTEQLFENNQREYNESDGKKWGDGKSFLRMPKNEYFSSGYGRGHQAGRYDLEEEVCQRSDNRRYRIWKGKSSAADHIFRHSGSGQTAGAGIAVNCWNGSRCHHPGREPDEQFYPGCSNGGHGHHYAHRWFGRTPPRLSGLETDQHHGQLFSQSGVSGPRCGLRHLPARDKFTGQFLHHHRQHGQDLSDRVRHAQSDLLPEGPSVASNTTGNWVTNRVPGLYLYGALLELAVFFDDDERIATWGTLYDRSMKELQGSDVTARYAKVAMRIKGVTP